MTHALQGGNKISDGGASSLSEALKFNTCLRELNLVSAGCGRGGDVEVAMCMFVHAGVCVLQGCIGSACLIVRGGSCVRGLRCEDGLRGGGVECFVLRGFGARGMGHQGYWLSFFVGFRVIV